MTEQQGKILSSCYYLNPYSFGIFSLSSCVTGPKQNCQSKDASLSDDGNHSVKGEEDNPKAADPQVSKRVRPGESCSDAEIDYRRARSLREANGILAWRNSLP